MEKIQELLERVSELEQLNKKLFALQYLFEKLPLAQTKTELLKESLSILEKIIELKSASFYLVENGVYKKIISVGSTDEYKQIETENKNNGIFDWAMSQGKSVFIPTTESEFTGLIPLVIGKKQIGLISLFTGKEVDYSTLSLLNFYAVELAFLIDNLNAKILIKEKSTLLNAVIDSVPAALIILNENYEITFYNKNFMQFFKLKDADYNGIKIDELFTETVSKKFISLISECKKGPVVDREELIKFAYEELPLRINVVPVENPFTHSKEYLFTLTNISSEREVDKMKELNKLKDEFLSTVSHEIKTPLAGIIASAESILHFPDISVEDRNKMLEIIVKEGNRLVNMVSDLLEASKIEAGVMEYNFQNVPALRVLNRAIEVMQPFAEKYDVEIISEVIEEPIIVADEDKILQVLQNILSNSIKFSPQHSIIEVKLTREGSYGVFIIRDYAGGMSPKEVKELFTRYKQGTKKSDRQKGTGLGMYISKEIITNHKGDIKVVSKLGEGTIFKVLIPAVS